MKQEIPPSSPHGLRVLLLDDESDDRKLAIRELEKAFPGVEVTTATEETALQRVLQQGDFDVVITDYELRWTDGLAILRRVKEHFPETPVIMFTATGTQEIAVEAMKAGLDDYVIKSPAHYIRLPIAVQSSLEKRRERRAIHEVQARLAAIVESSDDAIIGKRLDGTIVDWNRGAERMYGYSAMEAVGRPISLLIPPEHTDEYDDIMGRLKRGLPIHRLETQRVRKDGARIEVSLTISPIKNPTGEIVGASAIARDITDQKRLERELREHVEELVAAGRRKDQFLSMLAHELRNPLGAISNALHVMSLSQQNSPSYERARASARRQIQHQTRLVDDLLDVSRITQNRLELRRERLELVRLVRETVEDFVATLEAAGLSVKVEMPDGPVPVEGDRTRLAQVLGNLLDNAAKFTPPGGDVTVTVAAGPEAHVAAVTVRDTGRGIEPDLLSHVFDPLTQADRSLERSLGGLGLGLTFVKGLVELHGGSVRAHSEGTGRGSEFTFMLPVESEPPAVVNSLMPSRPPVGHLRVLIVEDNRDAARTLRDLLELFGYEVALAYTGPQGLEVARRFRPEVVLCDIGLPGMDGYQVASELRRDPATSLAHLIAVTGYGGEEDRSRSREVGFEQHLTKPVDPEQLQRLLASVAPQ